MLGKIKIILLMEASVLFCHSLLCPSIFGWDLYVRVGNVPFMYKPVWRSVLLTNVSCGSTKLLFCDLLGFDLPSPTILNIIARPPFHIFPSLQTPAVPEMYLLALTQTLCPKVPSSRRHGPDHPSKQTALHWEQWWFTRCLLAAMNHPP